MKSKQKSVFIMKAIACFLGLALAACSDDLPHVFGGNEVPQEALDQPRVVMVPKQNSRANPAWPRLGDVPAKPNDFSPQSSIDQAKQQMENNRSEAQIFRQQYQDEEPSPLVTPQDSRP